MIVDARKPLTMAVGLGSHEDYFMWDTDLYQWIGSDTKEVTAYNLNRAYVSKVKNDTQVLFVAVTITIKDLK